MPSSWISNSTQAISIALRPNIPRLSASGLGVAHVPLADNQPVVPY